MSFIRAGNASAGRESSRWVREVPHLALGLVLLEWLFRHAWIGDEVVLGADVGLFALPRFQLLTELWRGGSLPGWNPWFSGGAPLYGDLSFAVLYPLNALVLVLEPLEALAVYLMGHLALGYLGTYVLLRDRRCGRHAAAIAALAFGAGGVALGHVHTPIYVATTGWLPWCVLGFVRWQRAPASSRRLVLAVAPFALTFLAGSPETCATAAGIALLVARGDGWPWARLVGGMLLVGVVTALCCAALLVPALFVIAESTRAVGLSASEAGRWSLSPLQLAQLVAPLRVGYERLPVEVLGSDYRPWHTSLYAGIAPFGGLLLGLGLAWRTQRAVLVGAGALLVLAFGSYTPLYPVLSEWVPGLRAFRYPAKLFVPAWFLGCLIAGPGLARACADARLRRVVLVLGALALVLSAGAAWWSTAAAVWGALAVGSALAAAACLSTRRPLSWLLALTLLELAVAGNAQLETAPRGLFEPPMLAQAVQREQQRHGVPQRVGTLSSALEMGIDLSAHGATRMASEQASWRQALLPNAGAPYGVRTVTGFSSITLARGRALRDLGNELDVGEVELNALLGAQLLVYTLGDVADVASAVAPVADAGLWRLGRLEGALPWVALYRAPRFAASTREAAQLRFAAPHTQVVLEAEPFAWVQPGAGEAGSEGAPPLGQIALLRLEHDRVELQVAAREPCVLVLRESYASGWEARLDGEPTRIVPADVAFRAVEVPAGVHTIGFAYRVRGLSLGLVLSVLGLLSLGLPWVVRRLFTARPGF